MAGTDLSTRPRPLLEKVRTVGGVLAALTALVAWATSFGFLTEQQSTASSALLALVPGTLSAVAAVLTAFGVVKSGEKLVTPLSSPQDNEGNRLTAQKSGTPKQRTDEPW